MSLSLRHTERQYGILLTDTRTQNSQFFPNGALIYIFFCTHPMSQSYSSFAITLFYSTSVTVTAYISLWGIPTERGLDLHSAGATPCVLVYSTRRPTYVEQRVGKKRLPLPGGEWALLIERQRPIKSAITMKQDTGHI